MSEWPSFDELKTLARNNPAELEAWRQNEIEKLIDNASPSHQQRLRGLQFQIDGERRRHKTPLSACIAISRKMHHSLNELNDALSQFNGNPVTTQTAPDNAKTDAIVLNFPKQPENKAC